LSLPVIILGGIVFGVVTPTEAAALTVVAALAVGCWYGGLSRADLSQSLVQTAALTGAIFMILGAVACFSWLAGHEQLPQRLAGFVTELGLGQTAYLLVINLIFVVAGMVLDPPVALALLVPLLGPPAVTLGVDPVHLGIVLCLNLTIGLITPPVGGCLLAVSTVCKVEYWALARAIFPFAIMEVLLLLVIVLLPELSLFLPRTFGLVA
jgi:tripartite ATP-independent transporter DctM subunit